MVNNKAEQVYRLPIVSSTVFGQLLHSIFLFQHDPETAEDGRTTESQSQTQDLDRDRVELSTAIDFHLTLQNSSGHFKFTV